MAQLHITQGLPASGKSTFAKGWVAADPDHRLRINRDDIRRMLYGKPYGVNENAVTQIQHSMIESALRAGQDVISDDTNLNAKFAKELLKIAGKVGAEIVWHREFLDVDVRECIDRDSLRLPTNGQVGERVIMNFYERYLKGGKPKLPKLSEEPDLSIFKPYTGTPGKPKAFLVDIDGTIATNGTRDDPARGYFDWDKVDLDDPVMVIIDIVRHFEAQGLRAIFVSGRDGAARKKTATWIYNNTGLDPWARLFMRAEGDMRKDNIVKLEIFDREIRDNYDVQFALDDRNQVVRAYRDILGLTVLQVADGDF